MLLPTQDVLWMENLLKESGADGVMIGRGSYGKPWFLSQVNDYLESGVYTAAPNLNSQYQIIKSHGLNTSNRQAFKTH